MTTRLVDRVQALFEAEPAADASWLSVSGARPVDRADRLLTVLEAFHRLGISTRAAQFYAVHAEADPRHGKDWLERVIEPLADEVPDWGKRMVRGAAWRWIVNAELLDALGEQASTAAAA